MTRIMREKKQCAVCGRFNVITKILSIFVRGESSLGKNNRLGLHSRTNMMSFNEKETCKFCGYQYSSIDKLNGRKKNLIIKSEKYQSIKNNLELNDDFKEFYLSGILAEELKYYSAAAYRYANAYEYADNEKLKEDIINKVILLYEKPYSNSLRLQEKLILVDFYRRSKNFAKCMEFIQNELSDTGDSRLEQVLKTEVKFCKQKNCENYFENLFREFLEMR